MIGFFRVPGMSAPGRSLNQLRSSGKKACLDCDSASAEGGLPERLRKCLSTRLKWVNTRKAGKVVVCDHGFK
jgi:hypothetical protein